MVEYYIISELNSYNKLKVALNNQNFNIFLSSNKFFLLWPVYNNFLAILNNLKTIGCTI
jgi:hypothetical protein